MDLLYYFYECSQNWAYEGANLSHAGGLVFCSSKTPVSKIRKVANDLADEIKEKSFGRKNNYFDYVVLESIDYPVEDSMHGFFNNHYAGMAATRYALSPVENWFDEKGIKYQLKEILAELPKGQIYKIAAEVANNNGNKEIEKAEARLKQLTGKTRYEKLEHMLDLLFAMPVPDSPHNTETDSAEADSAEAGRGEIAENEKPVEFNAAWKWLYLLELWDYLIPELKNTKPAKKENADG